MGRPMIRLIRQELGKSRRRQTKEKIRIGTERAPIERMVWIFWQLIEGHQVNGRIVAEHFEVSRKTVERDLNFLRDRLGVDFQFRGGSGDSCNTYVLSNRSCPFCGRQCDARGRAAA